MAWLGRQDLEDREHRTLHRFATLSDRAGGRRLDEPEDPIRTAFQRDRDRIIHCTAFRRLQHKTQVMAAFEGDHYRSRMTHSLEVAQLARGVAHALRLNADLAEAVALAHDLGHPPFGHVGEDGLAERMATHGGFRHNAQGARIVDCLEDPYAHGFGLNLTLVVRQSLLKGPVPDGFPLSADLHTGRELPLEAQVVDRCDKIAYLCHDLDDGLRAGAFTEADAAGLRLWQRAAQRCASPVTARIVSDMIAILVHDLIETTATRLDAATTSPRPAHSAEVTVLTDELQRFLRTEFYRSRMVLERMQHGVEQLCAVFDALLAKPEGLPAKARARLTRDGLERTVCDHVAGMTDRYLVRQPT